MKPETLAITSSKNYKKNQGTVNTPIHKTSTVLFETWEQYMEAEHGKDVYESGNGQIADYSYGIGGTPTRFDLQKTLAELEGADYALVTPSGLSSITTVLLSLVNSGDNILVSDSVYGPTRRFCNKELKRLGVETTYYDPLIGSDIKELIKENTKLIFTESPGSLTFEIQDIPAISKVAKEKDIPVVIDNSWGTSLYFKPFEHGVDISIQAGTKYIGGHSDLILGTITCNNKYIKKVFNTYKNLGVSVSPEDCYMALRGIRTMPVRIKKHEESALNIAKWLEGHSKVKSVLHPALPSFEGYELWKRDFKGSTGLFTIILDKKYSYESICKMINGMKYFGIGASWGGYESLIINFDPKTIRTAKKWDIEETCIRLYIGLEAEDDLQEDIESGLKRLG
jgi:cystathionine beta-lyase